MRMLRNIGALGALTLALASCSAEVTGSPDLPDSSTVNSQSNTGTFANFKPCDVLNSVKDDFIPPLDNIKEHKDSRLKGVYCEADYDGKFKFALSNSTIKGLAQSEGSPFAAKPVDIMVNNRKAKLIQRASTPQDCAVVLDVGPHASTTIDVGSPTEPLEKSCELAQSFAKQLEPQVPTE